MSWVTSINLGESSTQLDALNVAKESITQWCKENNVNGAIHKASQVNNNKTSARYLSLITKNGNWYVYQLVISSYHKIIGTKEVDNLIPGFEKIISNVYEDKPTYFAKLKRVYNLNSLRDRNKEVLYAAR